MEENFNEETSLLSFNGVIGRRDFFLNKIIIASIALLFTLPYQIHLLANMQSLTDIFNIGKSFLAAPILLKIWLVMGIFLVVVLDISNITRRTRDITCEENSPLNYIFCGALIIASLYFILPLWITSIFISLSVLICLYLLFKKGEITGKLPYDYKKEFNWGAFLGTWIWGLFNKSYKTLWMLLLGLTPWGTYFSVYCGLKGNEWAFKNKNCTDVEEFNKSQRTQTTVFAILFCCIVPILYFLIVTAIIIIIALAVATGDGAKGNTEVKDPAAKIESVLNSFGSMYFVKHEITPLENKYYVSSKDWKDCSFSNKKDLLDLAASMAASEKTRLYRNDNSKKYEYYSKTDELPRTKIYSNETGELLGEFVFDEEIFAKEKTSFMDLVKAGMNSYRFYKPEK